MEIELGTKMQHDRAEADRRPIHQHELARDGDRAERTQALLDLPHLAAAVSMRRHPVRNRAHAIVEERRIDEAGPDVERVDDLVGELLEAPAAISLDDAVAVVVAQAFIEIDDALHETRREDADATEVEEIDPGRRRSRLAARLLLLVEDGVVAEMRIAVDDAELGEGIPPGAEHGGGNPVALLEAVIEMSEERLAVQPLHGEEALGRKLVRHRR